MAIKQWLSTTDCRSFSSKHRINRVRCLAQVQKLSVNVVLNDFVPNQPNSTDEVTLPSYYAYFLVAEVKINFN